MDEVIKKLLRSPECRKLFKQRPEPPPAKGKAPAKKATKTPDKKRRGTWANARALQSKLIFRLKKYGKANPAAIELLGILTKCRRKRRCCNPACPKCTYAAQGLWAMLLRDFMDAGNNLDRCVTIVALRRILPDNDRGYVKVGWFRAELDDAFDDANVTLVVGAFDFDVSEFPDGEYKDHCRPHFHALALSSECDKGDAVIRKHFTTKGSVFKPVQIEPFDDNERWLWYTLKIPNTRKVRRADEERGDDGSVRQKDPDYRELRTLQHVQQALLLHNLGWSGRFYLRGVELKESKMNRWFLART